MASLTTSKTGYKRIFFYLHKERKTVHLGQEVTKKDAEALKKRIESILNSVILGRTIDQDDAAWLAKSPEYREKLEDVGLLPRDPGKLGHLNPTVADHLDQYVKVHGASKKPGTVAVWRQVVQNLKDELPKGIRLRDVTVGHAKHFQARLREKGMKPTTVHKRIQFCRQFFNDAVDWKLIQENPFRKVKSVEPSTKSNEFVDRAKIDQLMRFANPTWRTIIALSRYGGLRCPSETLSLKWSHVDFAANKLLVPEPKVEHHEGRGLREVPIFAELLPYLLDAYELRSDDEYVIDKPGYRAKANTGDGWKNANLRTQFAKLIDKAGLQPWARLFHSLRASRQTELEREYSTHVVCAWLGNSIRIAQKNYLLVTEDDFRRAVEKKLVESESDESRGTKPTRAGAFHGTKPTLQESATSRTDEQITNENTGENAKTQGNTQNWERRGQDSNLR